MLGMIPVPGIMIRAPNRLFSVCVELTMLPSPSAIVTCVVFADSLDSTRESKVPARFGSISRRRRSA